MTREEWADLLARSGDAIREAVETAFDRLAGEVFERPPGERLGDWPEVEIDAAAVRAAVATGDPDGADPAAVLAVAAFVAREVRGKVRAAVLEGLSGDALSARLADVRKLAVRDAASRAAGDGLAAAAARRGAFGRLVLSARACKFCRTFAGRLYRPGQSGPPLHSGCGCHISWEA